MLSEEDISAYAGMLILPSFMAHLERSPFRFADQTLANDGVQALRLFYTGEGRYEEYELQPDKHALSLLRHVCPNCHLEHLRFRDEEPRWRWSRSFQNSGPAMSGGAETAAALRIYFDPGRVSLPVESSRSFDPKQCHVSVTRMEINISRNALQHYVATWLDLWDDHSEAVSEKLLPDLDVMAGGFTFHRNKLGGEFTVLNDETLRDLFCYCRLSKTLEELQALVRPDFGSVETSISDEGLHFKLLAVNSETR